MSGSFKILEAVVNAYSFAGREAGYLFKIGVLPLCVQYATAMYIHLIRPDASSIESFLWSLPASALFAWFMFLEARLILLGERVDRMKKDDVLSFNRQRALRLCIIIFLLFQMAVTAAGAFFEWSVVSGSFQRNTFVSVLCMLLIGALFWGLRFGVAHILASINYSIRRFIFVVNGIEFSLRLIGMGILCIFPLIFISDIIASLLLGGRQPQEISKADTYLLIALAAPLSLLAAAVLNAAAAYALKQILEREDLENRHKNIS